MLNSKFISKTKILTFIEIGRLIMSLVTMLITAQFYPPEEYVVVVNVVSISTLFSAVTSFGLPILLLTKPDKESQKFSEAGFLVSLTIFGPLFLVCECLSLVHHGVSLSQAFPLVLAEVLFAGVIQFNSRKLLAEQNINSLLVLVGLSTLARLAAFCTAAFTGQYTTVYWVYAVTIVFLAIWNTSLSINQAWKLKNQGQLAIKESFAMGASSMLTTALDNLPTYLATILLPPANSATFALALRITSVSTIPGQSLTTAILPRMKKHAKNRSFEVALMGTGASLALTAIAILILKSGILFAHYSSLTTYVLLFAPLAWARLFGISYGNILFIHGYAKSRIIYIACGLATLIFSFFVSETLNAQNQPKFLIISCVIVEILITIAIVWKATQILKQQSDKEDATDLDATSTN